MSTNLFGTHLIIYPEIDYISLETATVSITIYWFKYMHFCKIQLDIEPTADITWLDYSLCSLTYETELTGSKQSTLQSHTLSLCCAALARTCSFHCGYNLSIYASYSSYKNSIFLSMFPNVICIKIGDYLDVYVEQLAMFTQDLSLCLWLVMNQ